MLLEFFVKNLDGDVRVTVLRLFLAQILGLEHDSHTAMANDAFQHKTTFEHRANCGCGAARFGTAGPLIGTTPRRGSRTRLSGLACLTRMPCLSCLPGVTCGRSKLSGLTTVTGRIRLRTWSGT